ncbi:MAG: DUF2145 domain-containing protein [Microbacteriaceae bacterium]|nr:DUF2145 domain-containing protein [Burkholderiaceae bacterium]
MRVLALCGLLPWAACQNSQAGVLRYCDPPTPLDAVQQDRLLRFGAVIKTELDRSGDTLALVARSGLALERFGQRYSHAGISLRDSGNAPWSVRQLYFDCEQARPRLFDQGIAGFLLGGADPDIGYVSVLLLPPDDAAPLALAVQDKRQALRLLGKRYSANAHAFSLRYQNCNQWLAELLAVAWGDLATGDAGREGDELRRDAQQWLQAHGYVPTSFELGNPLLLWLGGQLPWLHTDDHPADDLAAWQLRVSMPASIAAFVQRRLPATRRIEFCHNARHIVVRHDGAPIAEGCQPESQDTVVMLAPR